MSGYLGCLGGHVAQQQVGDALHGMLSDLRWGCCLGSDAAVGVWLGAANVRASTSKCEDYSRI